MAFEKIKGHLKNINGIVNIINSKEIPSSFLFCGKEGVGKLTIAKEFAKISLCKSKINNEDFLSFDSNDGLDCPGCESCRMFELGVHPDFLLVDFNYQAGLLGEKVSEQKSIGIDTVREAVKFSNLKPSFCFRKFIVINDAEKMTVEAQNSLLKTLEEPFEGTTIILVSSSSNKILPTILSRCYKLVFNRLSQSAVMDILAEKGYEIKRAELLSEISEGSVSLAFKYEKVLQMFEENAQKPYIAPFLITSKLSKTEDFREGAVTVLNFINSFLYFKMKNYNNTDKITKAIKENFKYMNYLKHNVNTRLVLSAALYKFFSEFDFFKQGAVL
ncbi:MAG: hypothetical protein N2Z60_03165 [Elusimicrobiales bacterium]|nr:hypothetical protein [Elusimicrobiales bacterium]